MKKLYYLTPLLFLMVGCTPMKVRTSIENKSNVSIAPEEVKVLMLDDSEPATSQLVGSISVKDNGFSKTIPFTEVVAIASIKTAESGANILKITNHIEPSVWGSTCHQIAGRMLYEADREVLEFQPNNILGLNTATRRAKANKRDAHGSVSIKTGPSIVLSKIYGSGGQELEKNVGIDVQLNIRKVWNSGLGFGVVLSKGWGSYMAGLAKIRLGYDYYAPEFVVGGGVSNKCDMYFSLGGGYFMHRKSNYYSHLGISAFDKSLSKALGTHISYTVDWALGKNFALGLDAQLVHAIFGKKDGSISRLNLSIAAKYSF